MPNVSVAWISRPRVGESVSGDAVVVRPYGSAVLISVIDALGHGPKAAEVARISSDWLASIEEAGGAPILVNGLHKQLHGSRGAAALLLVVSTTGLEACSVGNVELRSETNRLPFVLTPGVLGVRLRQPKICSSPLTTDRFILHSDGISGRFDIRSLRSSTPTEVATQLFGSHRHAHDDATVVVVDVTQPS
ncbi:MAG: Phosphoserine phosphatase RsbX [Labilithrix sp.]|nr:Phosphoserine phosphatase RsbX [Labilithrix sp.]